MQPTGFVSWDTKRLNRAANIFESKPEPSKRGVAGAIVDLAKMVLSSEGSPTVGVETNKSLGKASGTETLKKAMVVTATSPRQQ
jgi:hypothetical protein